MTAHARWCYGAAFTRVESRGMHHRTDAPASDARLNHRLTVGGLDQIWVQPETLSNSREAA
jgi:aspartate oxidase